MTAPKTSAVKNFAAAFAYPFKGLTFLGKHRLLAAALPAIILNVIILAVAIYLVFTKGADFFEYLTGLIPSGEEGSYLAKFVYFLGKGLKILLTLLLLIITLFFVNILGAACASPLLDILSAKCEKKLQLLEIPELPFFTSLILSVKNALLAVVLQMFIWLFLLPLNLIPVIGGVLYFVLSSVSTWFFASLQYLSYPLDRRLVPLSYQIKTIFSNKMAAFGFGAGVTFITFLPLVNLIFLPLAAAGGTLFSTDLWLDNCLPPEVLKYFAPRVNSTSQR